MRASVRVAREGLHAGRPPMHRAQEGQRGAARRVRSGEELRRRLTEIRDLRLHRDSPHGIRDARHVRVLGVRQMVEHVVRLD